MFFHYFLYQVETTALRRSFLHIFSKIIRTDLGVVVLRQHTNQSGIRLSIVVDFDGEKLILPSLLLPKPTGLQRNLFLRNKKIFIELGVGVLRQHTNQSGIRVSTVVDLDGEKLVLEGLLLLLPTGLQRNFFLRNKFFFIEMLQELILWERLEGGVSESTAGVHVMEGSSWPTRQSRSPC